MWIERVNTLPSQAHACSHSVSLSSTSFSEVVVVEGRTSFLAIQASQYAISRKGLTPCLSEWLESLREVVLAAAVSARWRRKQPFAAPTTLR